MDTPLKINMEPNKTPPEEEHHLNQTIIFRFSVNLQGGTQNGGLETPFTGPHGIWDPPTVPTAGGLGAVAVPPEPSSGGGLGGAGVGIG